MNKEVKIAFLHHSTGGVIYKGNTSKIIYKLFKKGDVSKWFADYNKKNKTNYTIESIIFPKNEPYGWNNYPFDYYNIWVKNAGEVPYKDEPTLEFLTKQYDIIIFKHCYPVGDIAIDSVSSNIDSDIKTIENYKLQYEKLKEKLKTFPDTKFLLWTGPALTKATTNQDKAVKTMEFFKWVKEEWDEPGDNIFLWDFFQLETEGDIYLKDDYAVSPDNPHPNQKFAGKVAPLFCNRIINIIENKGDNTSLTGN